MRRPLGEGGVEQAPGLGLLRKALEAWHAPPSRSPRRLRAVERDDPRAEDQAELAVGHVDRAQELRALALDAIGRPSPARRRPPPDRRAAERSRPGGCRGSRRCSERARDRRRGRARSPGRRATSRGSGRRRRRPCARAPARSLPRRAPPARPRTAPPRPTARSSSRRGRSSRTFSPSSVPPGSRVTTTSRPSASRCAPSSSA